MSYKRVADRIYRDSRTGHYYERPKVDGRWTWRKLDGHTVTLARESLAQRRADVARSRLGLSRSPYAPKSVPIGDLIDAYEQAGCPNRRGVPRTGYALHHELARLRLLRPFWAKIREVHPQTDPRRYFAHRRKTRRNTHAHGGRAVDIELTTLANVFAHEIRTGRLLVNPLSERPRFQTAAVQHCRDAAPRNSDELHLLAAHFFRRPGSALLGWQLIIEAFTGCRTNEVLQLRWNASNHEPGHIEGDWLWLNRSKSGCNPFALIHPALRDCLTAFSLWRAKRPRLARRPEMLPIHRQSLAHALRKAGPLLLKRRITSHGLRAFYATVRRSQGASDAQVAAEIGDRSGAAIIASTYGAIPPNWQGRAGLDWLPKGQPAWATLTPGNGIQSGIQSPRPQRAPLAERKRAIC